MSAYQMGQHSEDLARELNEARKIQMGMLPQSVPEIAGFQIAAHSSPAVAVGGDFYDFIKLGDDKLGVVIGDAVGHGIAAALLMTMTLTDFRSMAPRYASSAEVLNSVNRRLTQSMRTRAFVTSIYAVLDRSSNRLSCAMAGMQPLLIKTKSGECVSVEPSDIPLGASQKIQYQSCDVQMDMGDSLVLYTDGIPEAANEDDEMYSFERLEETLIENSGADAQRLMDTVLSDVRQFTGNQPQEDDITLVVLKAIESLAVAPVAPTTRLITGEQRSVTMLIAVGDSELPLPVVEEVNALAREHGSVVDALGDDTIVALFGVPVFHEDDAERAVTTAQMIHELDIPVAFRIGIDTGTAIIRSDEDIDYHEMGETMHRALHLANAAEPGQVLLSERAYQLTRGAFQFGEVTKIQPSEEEPITTYPVVASAAQPRRTRGIEGLYAPMIGRDREMEQLTVCIDDLLDGRGAIVSVNGEAGIGKTRLVSELRKCAGDQVRWLEGRCISYGQAMNYCPFRGIISSYLGILPTDTEDDMKAKLHNKVTNLLPEQRRWAPIHVGNLFFPQYEAELLTASGDDYAKQYTYPILRNLFHRIADEKPVVMVFEDLHWSDPTSLAVLEFLMESIDEAPILYLWVYRPYRDSDVWRLRQRADQEFDYCNTEIDLSILPNEQTDALLSELLHIPDIPENMRALVQDKASGNPLYIEEIIRSFVDEEAVIRDADYWRATVESAGIVPSDTLQGVILARVDRLDPDVKEVLQIASVVGDSFLLALLEAVTDKNLSSSLRALERAQMLQRKRVGQEWEYSFFHPLVHDVVYHSLLLEDRAALHEKAGVAIESMHSEYLDDYIDALAHHYGHSDSIEKALHYLTLAGDKAHKLASYWEALDYYGIAMVKAENLADGQRKKQVIVDLVMKRNRPRHWLGALRPDVAELEKYLGWAEELEDKDRIQSFYEEILGHCIWMGETEKGKPYFRKYLTTMEDKDRAYIERVWGPQAYVIWSGYSYLQEGNCEEWALVEQQALENRYDQALSELRSGKVDQVDDGFFNNYMNLTKPYRIMGQWHKALALCQDALDLATEYSISSRIIQGHTDLGKTYLCMGEWDKVITECETALNMSPSGFSIHWIVTTLGDAYCRTGQLDRGMLLLERWEEYARRVGRGPIAECEYCLPLAEGHLAQGDFDKAQMNADEALQVALKHGYAFHEAKAYRILGKMMAPTDFPSAEDHFSRSLKIMQRIKARNEEGITELSWGCACRQYGDMEQAKAHLTRAAEIFEGLGTTRYLEWTREALATLVQE
ncbi:SpoIIE family protein phosphatase [Candidatus Poribacteria bacterium]